MFVDTRLLHAGGNDARRAGEEARAGAHALSRGPLPPGMFGEFTTAAAFHDALSSALIRHLTRLQEIHNTLESLSDRALQSAAAFTDMDDRNATAMRRVITAGGAGDGYPQPRGGSSSTAREAS